MLALELPAQGRAVRLDVLHRKAGDEDDALPDAVHAGQGRQGQHAEGGTVRPAAVQPDEAPMREPEGALAHGVAPPFHRDALDAAQLIGPISLARARNPSARHSPTTEGKTSVPAAVTRLV